MKQIEIDLNLFQHYLTRKDYTSLAACLKKSFAIEKDANGQPVQCQISKDVINALIHLLNSMQLNDLNDTQIDLIKEVYRSLRNYVVNPQVQNYIISDIQFLSNTRQFMNISSDDLLKIIIQFLINLIVSNVENAQKVFDTYKHEIIGFLKQKKCTYEISALLHNISVNKSLESIYDKESCSIVFDLYDSDENNVYLQFLIEAFVTYNVFWQDYLELNVKFRLITLELIKDQQVQGKALNLPQHAINTLTNQFINSASSVIFLTAAKNTCDLQSYEISQILEVISSLCSNEIHQKHFEAVNSDLLINSGVLLINIHRLGKTSQNYFTAIEKLADLQQPSDEIRDHPAFGFKANLIRVIGNLCWKNAKMQDLAREAELIPVLLDCCNMDARNPFIIQWVILAVRNLCEKNAKNQQIIANLHKQGEVSTATLVEMGLTLHSDGENSIRLVPI